MSKTSVSIQFGVCVDDYERWTPEHLEECNSSMNDDYADFAAQKLYEVMREAGNKFIKENPDLFCSKEVV